VLRRQTGGEAYVLGFDSTPQSDLGKIGATGPLGHQRSPRSHPLGGRMSNHRKWDARLLSTPAADASAESLFGLAV